jgi:UDP-glucose 4-epimerase
MYVDDLIDVVIPALDGRGRSGPYHVSSGSDVSIKELFDATLSALHITLEHAVEVRPRNPDDAYTILLDPSRTNADFEWRASTPLGAGVASAIDWYKRFGIHQTFTHLRLDEKK